VALIDEGFQNSQPPAELIKLEFERVVVDTVVANKAWEDIASDKVG
jgi:hypothetical protein